MSGPENDTRTVTVTGIPIPHVTSDPPPPEDDAADQEWNDYRSELAQYTTDWCGMMSNAANTPGEALWSDFTCDFSEKGRLNLNASDSLRIRELLLSRGVHVISRRGYFRAKALVECWAKDKCPLSSENPDAKELPLSNNRLHDGAAVQVDEAQSRTVARSSGHLHEHSVADRETHTTGSGGSNGTGRSGNLQGLMKAFAGGKNYFGAWEEDFYGTVEVYEMSANMCDISNEEMVKGIPIMLDGPALTYFASNLKTSASYEVAIQKLVSLYTSEE